MIMWPELMPRLGMALLLGAVIWFERQWRQRGAGLQTNALVSLGAPAFVSLPGLLDGL
ncbi:MgtC/SapB family protein [Nitrospira sp. Nam74]